MRVQQRYKHFSKHFNPFFCLPKDKILKFYRPKWKAVQKLILKEKLKKIKSRLTFKYFGKAFCRANRWDKSSHFFKNQILVNNTIKNLFLNSVSNKCLKKLFLQRNTKFSGVQIFLYKLEFRIDILLARLFSFNTSFLIKENLKKKLFFLNNQKISTLITLVKGDVLFIPESQIVNFQTKFKSALLLHTFIELDFYTNEIVIIKNWNDLVDKDFFLLSRDFYNVLELRNHFRH